jgi:predicted ATPase/Tfp pilus assembly protein PilF
MSEQVSLRLLASRLACDRLIDWEAEERAAGTEEKRERVRQLRMVAAMAAFHSAVQSYEAGDDLSRSISIAKGIAPKLVAGELVAGRYLIKGLVGRGGMGEVYEAWDEELSIPVALKTLRLPAGSEEEALQHLRREGLLARSVSHPNVCRVYDLGRHGESQDALWFLTMEVLRGETLAERLRGAGRLPLEEVLPLAQQMAAGLGAAHQVGVVHRDFKPSNVMLVRVDAGEQAVVTDFGIARAGVEEAMETPIIGTPAYMAPEQMRGEEVGPAADIYALGIVLYEMVTGTLPFGNGSAIEVAKRRLVEEAPSPRTIVPELDERWEAVILRCLAREPRRRFARAEEVQEELAGRPRVVAVGGLNSAPPARHTLPAERDAFVGREAELEELARKLSGGARLVTLVGAGGMGKTRLAVRYGWRSLAEWPGGVWFCDLTEARSANGIASAVAGPLGMSLGRGDAVEQLGHAIAGRGRCLMILDNIEQVVEITAATVSRWMARAGDARFVVTSRERLSLDDGEELQAVEPLPSEAGVELFKTRARWLRPGLELTGVEGGSVGEVVRLVEGIPLAIELAAARMRMMSAEQIVAQMRKRFQLLTGGRSARHETLAAVIDGSWELLRPWEKAAMAQCSVFEGGFTLEAAEAVVDLGAWPEAPWTVEVVQSLVDKSLLRSWVPEQAVSAGVPAVRFGMYVTLQEYARERLREANAVAEVGNGQQAEQAAEERHGRWYAAYGTEEAIEAVNSDGGVERWWRLQWDRENLILACRRALARRDGGTAAAAYRAVGEVFNKRGPFGMSVELGRQVSESPLDCEDRGRILVTLGQAEWLAGRRDEARSHFEAALAIHRELGNRLFEGMILVNLSVILSDQGLMEEALVGHEAALAIYREVGNRRLEGVVLRTLATLHLDQGRMEEARTHYEAALALHREVGNRWGEGIALGLVANMHLVQGRMEEARAHYEAALVIHREVGNRHFEGIVLGNLGVVHLDQGQMEEARAHFEPALVIARAAGDRPGEGIVLGNLGIVHHEQGRMEEARAHYEEALAIHRDVGNRRFEGIVLGRMASLHLEQGHLDEAREGLARGEALLREVGDRLELGKLLCVGAERARRMGDLAAARAALSEAETLAGHVGAGPESDLGRQLAKLHQTLTDR